MCKVPLYTMQASIAWEKRRSIALPTPASCSSFLLHSSLELSDTNVYESLIRALLGTSSHFCEVDDLNGQVFSLSPLSLTSLSLASFSHLSLSRLSLTARETRPSIRPPTLARSSSSLSLSSLELSDTHVMSLKYEPSSEPLYISAKKL